METRVAVISIIVEDPESVLAVNEYLLNAELYVLKTLALVLSLPVSNC